MQPIKKVRYSIFFLLHCFYFTVAQTIPYYHYTTDDGLCNNDIFDIAKDKNGNIWLATDNGLSKFDGNSFENYFVKDGLADNSLTGVGTWGDTIIIATYKHGIQSRIKGKIAPPLKQSEISFFNYCISTSSQFVVSERFARNNSKNKNKTLMFTKEFVQQVTSLTHLISYTTHTQKQPIYTQQTDTLYADGVRLCVLPIFLKNKQIYCLEKVKNKGWWLAVDKKIMVVDSDFRLMKTIDLKSILKDDLPFSLTVDALGFGWLKTQNGVGYRIEENGKIETINQLLGLPKGTLTRKLLYDDDNQGLWVAMAGKGLYYLDKNFITNYNLNQLADANNYVLSIGKDKFGTMWFGTENELVSKKGNEFNKMSIPNLRFFNQIYTVNNKTYFIGNRIGFKEYETPYYFMDNTDKQISFISAPVCEWNNKLFLAYMRVWHYDEERNLTILDYQTIDLNKKEALTLYNPRNNPVVLQAKLPQSIIDDIKIHTNTIVFKIGEDKLLYLTNKGILLIDEKRKTLEQFPGGDFFLNSKISDVFFDDRHRMFVLSDKGIGIYQNDRWIVQLAEQKGNSLRDAVCAALDSDNRLWVGTKTGLLVFFKDAVYKFSRLNGLPSSQIASLFFDKQTNQMWVGTDDGLSVFEIGKLAKKHYSKPVLRIGQISSLKENFEQGEDIELAYDDNYLNIKLATQRFENIKNLEFEYQLDEQSTWLPTSPTVVFSNLQYGTHKVNLRVKSPNGGISDPKILHFYIHPPFYKDWPFWMIVFIGLGMAIYLEYNRRKKRRIEQIKVKKQIAELQHQSLASMMNPHFIFNALNSIQYFVNTNDLLNANEYMASFGKLVRQNLEAVYKNTNTLADEIRFLELYIQLEQMRFPNRFGYQLIIDPNLTATTIHIPSMFVQPFVENAIIHGLLPQKQRKGNLWIRFWKETASYLRIEIEDDGVGLAPMHSTQGHISRSMQIIEKRIAILSQIADNDRVSVSVHQLKPLGKQGTLVILILKYQVQ